MCAWVRACVRVCAPMCVCARVGVSRVSGAVLLTSFTSMQLHRIQPHCLLHCQPAHPLFCCLFACLFLCGVCAMVACTDCCPLRIHLFIDGEPCPALPCPALPCPGLPGPALHYRWWPTMPSSAERSSISACHKICHHPCLPACLCVCLCLSPCQAEFTPQDFSRHKDNAEAAHTSLAEASTGVSERVCVRVCVCVCVRAHTRESACVCALGHSDER